MFDWNCCLLNNFDPHNNHALWSMLIVPPFLCVIYRCTIYNILRGRLFGYDRLHFRSAITVFDDGRFNGRRCLIVVRIAIVWYIVGAGAEVVRSLLEGVVLQCKLLYFIETNTIQTCLAYVFWRIGHINTQIRIEMVGSPLMLVFRINRFVFLLFW